MLSLNETIQRLEMTHRPLKSADIKSAATWLRYCREIMAEMETFLNKLEGNNE